MAAMPWRGPPALLSKEPPATAPRVRECSRAIWPYCVRIIPAIAEHSFLRCHVKHSRCAFIFAAVLLSSAGQDWWDGLCREDASNSWHVGNAKQQGFRVQDTPYWHGSRRYEQSVAREHGRVGEQAVGSLDVGHLQGRQGSTAQMKSFAASRPLPRAKYIDCKGLRP
jgi:hypothetical protein